MADIRVDRTEELEERYVLDVTVNEAGSETVHHVTLSKIDYERLGNLSASPEDFVARCFRFLLEREPKESILRQFDIRDIGSYFPDFEEHIRLHGTV
jgi:hypothetical protein